MLNHQTALVVVLLTGIPQSATAQFVNVYVGYLNNVSGPPNPADIPTPFDADASTILISSGGVNTTHDTGVIRIENLCPNAVTIDPGLNVVTQGGFFQIWDGSLPFVLGSGMNLVLAETANFNFDTSDFGLGSNPVVNGSIDGMGFSFTDTGRVLLGHEEAGNTPETTPYQVIGSIQCVPEPGSLVLFGMGTLGVVIPLLRRRKKVGPSATSAAD